MIMTVKQVIQQLSIYPENTDVYIRVDGEEFDHYPLESVELKNLRCSEGQEVGKQPEAYVDVVVLDVEI